VLYLDASALVKRYVRENGSDALQQRLEMCAPKERLFTSRITYAEIHTVLGRKLREGSVSRQDFSAMREKFHQDLLDAVDLLELSSATLGPLPQLVVEHPLKTNDAVHLSAALWLRDAAFLGLEDFADERGLEFVVCDRQLERAARRCGLTVYNPEKSS